MGRFEEAVGYVIDNEGGYSNTPGDRGGPTKFGITQAELAKWRGRAVTADDVKEMPRSEAEAIYHAWYWNAMRLDALSSQALATELLDTGVNRGIGRAIEYWQKALNLLGHAIPVDGRVGPATLAASVLVEDRDFIPVFERIEEDGYRAIGAHDPSQEKFEAGWLARARRYL